MPIYSTLWEYVNIRSLDLVNINKFRNYFRDLKNGSKKQLYFEKQKSGNRQDFNVKILTSF